MVAAYFVIQMALSIVAALLAGRGAARRIPTATLLILQLSLPFLGEFRPLPRGLLTYLALLSVMKVAQIAFSPQAQWTLSRRIWTAIMPFDVRRGRSVAPSFSLARTVKIAAFAVVAAIAWSAPFYVRLPTPGTARAVELTATVFFIYALMEVITGMLSFLHLLLGVRIEPIQRDPALARSVAEFWSERWNLPVTQWLHEFFFRPLAKCGHPRAGILAAFAVSAAFHAWLLFVAVDWRMGLLAGAFFVLQVPAMMLERHLRVRRWPAWAARAWTLLFLLAASPLLTVPLLRGLEMQMGR